MRRCLHVCRYSKEEKFFFRSKAVLHATDMSRKLPSLQKTKSMRYLWYVGPGWPPAPPSPLPPTVPVLVTTVPCSATVPPKTPRICVLDHNKC